MRGKKGSKKKESEDESGESDIEVLDEVSGNGKADDLEVNEIAAPILESSTSIRKLLLGHKEIETIGWGNIEGVYLPHPRTKGSSLFLLDTRNPVEDPEKEKFFIFEVLTLNQPTKSWFVDESIVKNGNLYAGTPIDPLFLVLPCLSQSKQGKPFQDHLIEHFSSTKIVDLFYNRIPSSQLENIAIKKEIGDIEAYTYSEENTLAWLEKKVRKISTFLFQQGITHAESSVSLNFVKADSDSSKDKKNGENDEEYLRYATDILGEYLEEDLKHKLLSKLGLPVIIPAAKRKGKNETNGEANGKKAKLEDGEDVKPLEDYGTTGTVPTPKNNKAKAKEEKLQKAAQGTKSLLSFFAPRSK